MEENRVETPQENPASHFDGSTLQLMGWRLLGWLLSIVTLGIGAAWAQCMVIRWETKHTVVEGRRLRFDGKGHQLLGRYLLWGLLTVITLGIYAIFIPVRMEKWRVSHTRFATEAEAAQGNSVSGLAILAGVFAGLLGLMLLLMGAWAVFANWDAVEDILRPAPPVQEQPSHGGQIIYVPMEPIAPVETLPPATEPTTADGIWLPRPDDDEDFWYVHNKKEGLSLRKGPGVEYELIRVLPHGTEIEVLEWENGWAFTGEGWCAGNYLEINPPKDAKPKEEAEPAAQKDLVGTWGLIRQWEETWNGDWYYVVMLRFYSDGTFRSETAGVSYDLIGGALNDKSWIPEGIIENTAFSGTYSYDGSTLRLQYSDGRTVKTSVSADGKYLKLSDPEGIPALREETSRHKEGKAYPVLLPLKDDVDIYFELPGVVGSYIG